MGANDWKYRTDLTTDLEKNGREYSMFYAMYLAEALSRGIDRDRAVRDQAGLRFRSSAQYKYQTTEIEAIAHAASYHLTDEILEALGVTLDASVVNALKPLRNEKSIDYPTLKDAIARLKENDSLNEVFPDDLLERVASAAAVPGFQFVLAIPGLYGPDSPLPRAYHQEVAYQQNERPTGFVPLQNFLDIFNNRIYWLYYQAWKKYRLHLQLTEHSQNPALKTLFSFSGLASTLNQDEPEKSGKSLLSRMPNSRFALLKLIGVFSQRTRNRGGLLAIFRMFFPRITFTVEEFVQSRRPLDGAPMIGSGHGQPEMRLGFDFNSILGNTVIDYTSTIGIVIGPISFDEFETLQPGATRHTLLVELLHLYLPDDIDFQLSYHVEARSFPSMTLSNPKLKMGLSSLLGKPVGPYVQIAPQRSFTGATT